VFQSAPALCRAGDLSATRILLVLRSFNPRPLFAERATHHARPSGSILGCFNPRPLFAERATIDRALLGHLAVVSIRARSLQSGRLAIHMVCGLIELFQSAPALCRAGDTRRV